MIINSKTSGSLWQHYRDDPNDIITQSKSLKHTIKITGKFPADVNTKDIEIEVPLKYLSNFWRTLEMPLINCEVNLILSWYCGISSATGAAKFKMTDTKLYVPVVTLSIEDNENYYNNQNQVLKEQLIGTNINQKFHQKDKNNI